MTSLRKRLLAWQGAAILVAALLAMWLGYAMAWQSFNRVRDHGLEQVAYAIVRHGLHSEGGDVATPEHPLADVNPSPHDPGQFMSQIWRSDGSLQYASSSEVGPPQQHDGFEDVLWHDQEWRVFSVRAEGKRVQVAVPTARRAASFDELLPGMVGLSLLAFVLLGVLSHLGIRLAFAPLLRLQQALEARNPQSMAPMATDDMPDEIKSLGLRFNQLLARLDGLLTEQRQFLSDAAHGLNTPLAALKLRAQLLPMVPAEQQPQAMDDLNQAIERTARLVMQLLRLVRIAPEVPSDQASVVDLGALAQQVCDELTPVAKRSGHALVWTPPPLPVRLRGDASGLRAMVENLISNALSYTPAGTEVRVQVSTGQGLASLQVQDNGPGIADAHKARALARFVRLTPGDGKGSGLGLTISQAVAQQHGGELCLQDTPGGGLTVVATLGAALPA